MRVTTLQRSVSDVWWRRIPLLAGRGSRLLPTILTDGIYLYTWPAAAGLAPPLALLIGFLIGWLHFAPGETYTFSIAIMALLLAIGNFGAALGAWLLIGYALGDFFLYPHTRDYFGSFFDALLRVRAPLLITYVLLAVLLVIVPLMSQGFQRQFTARLQRSSALRLVIGSSIQAVCQAALVWVWTQAVPTLIRPVYTWRGGQPPIEAIQPLQHNGIVLVALAAILGALRVVLEERAWHQPAIFQRYVQTKLGLARSAPRNGWHLPIWAAALLKAAFVTFVLAGLLTSWLDTIAFAGIFTLIVLLRAWLPTRLSAWARLVVRVPLLVRIAVGMAITYGMASWIVGVLWNQTATFLPILVSTTVSLIVFALLLPERAAPR